MERDDNRSFLSFAEHRNMGDPIEGYQVKASTEDLDSSQDKPDEMKSERAHVTAAFAFNFEAEIKD